MTTSFSRKVVIGTMVAFVLVLLGIMGRIAPYLVLDPTLLLGGQVWRLVSYPLVFGFFDLMAAAVAFSAPGEEVEGMLGSRQFLVLLLVVIVAGGVLHTMLYLHDPVAMSGTLNIALFVLIGYVYLFPQSSVRVFLFSLRSWIVLAVVVAVCAVQTYMDVNHGLGAAIVFSRGAFGLVVGLLYFHLRYQKYPVMLGSIRRLERLYAQSRVPASRVARPVARTKAPATIRMQRRTREVRAGTELVGDEERLNQILDRINEQGYDSLGEDDRRFLDRYSRGIS